MIQPRSGGALAFDVPTQAFLILTTETTPSSLVLQGVEWLLIHGGRFLDPVYSLRIDGAHPYASSEHCGYL